MISDIRDRLLSSFLLCYRLLLTASNRLLLSASSGHPLDRLDLDTYVPLHRVRESGLNPMFFTQCFLPVCQGRGALFRMLVPCYPMDSLSPRAYVPPHRMRELELNLNTYVPLHQCRELAVP